MHELSIFFEGMAAGLLLALLIILVTLHCALKESSR